jgi:hypothetical protein
VARKENTVNNGDKIMNTVEEGSDLIEIVNMVK